MDFIKEQLSELICKHTEKENGLHDLIQIMLESLMVSERREYLQEGISGKKCNGYRPVRTYGHGRTLTFRIQSMIYTTNWIERLACHEDVRGHAQRGIGHPAYGKTAMDKKSYMR